MHTSYFLNIKCNFTNASSFARNSEDIQWHALDADFSPTGSSASRLTRKNRGRTSRRIRTEKRYDASRRLRARAFHRFAVQHGRTFFHLSAYITRPSSTYVSLSRRKWIRRKGATRARFKSQRSRDNRTLSFIHGKRISLSPVDGEIRCPEDTVTGVSRIDRAVPHEELNNRETAENPLGEERSSPSVEFRRSGSLYEQSAANRRQAGFSRRKMDDGRPAVWVAGTYYYRLFGCTSRVPIFCYAEAGTSVQQPTGNISPTGHLSFPAASIIRAAGLCPESRFSIGWLRYRSTISPSSRGQSACGTIKLRDAYTQRDRD